MAAGRVRMSVRSWGDGGGSPQKIQTDPAVIRAYLGSKDLRRGGASLETGK